MTFLCEIPIISALIAACLPPLPLATGYVEGEYVLIAPVEVAQIEEVLVRRGDAIVAGQSLVRLESRDAEIAVAQARAALRQAESNLANLSQGRRPEEIAVIEASLASARAQAEETARDLARQGDLFRRGIATQARYDQARTADQVAQAAVSQIVANLEVATLPARADEISAAEAAVEQAAASTSAAEWRLSKRELNAVANGTVFDVIRNPGEVAGPQAPVLSVLPEGAVKLRLFVPEIEVSAIGPGTELAISCDGCAEGLRAIVSYVSTGPEFTPPVIYSLENRQKLVFLVEARPVAGATALKPGQIVSVDLKDAPK